MISAVVSNDYFLYFDKYNIDAKKCFTYGHWSTTNEWIASIMWHTVAVCFVVYHGTFSIVCTRTGTRIDATFVYTSLCIGTI